MKLKKFLIVVLCLLLPFTFASCSLFDWYDNDYYTGGGSGSGITIDNGSGGSGSGSGGSGGSGSGSGGGSGSGSGSGNNSQGGNNGQGDVNEEDYGYEGALEDYVEAVTIIKDGNGDNTYEDVQTLVNKITNAIIDGLFDEYGVGLVDKKRSEDDTHENAIWQDAWKFVGKVKYDSTLNKMEEWISEDDVGKTKADYSLVIKYNIYNILLGREVVGIQVSNLNSGSEYFTLKSNGVFSNENFEVLARAVSHTGIFTYELDRICEYVLNYVIGANAVEYDSHKFTDVNANGTFDYNETLVRLGAEYKFNSIKNYEFEKQRPEGTSRNELWDKITFGSALDEPVVPVGHEQIANERPIDLNILIANNLANSYQDENGVTKYSGFKNYVNMVYYIVYESVNSLDLTCHLANATFEDVDLSFITEKAEDTSEPTIDFGDCRAYSFKFKKSISIVYMYFMIYLPDDYTETVDFSTSVTYTHCLNTLDHSHNDECDFETVRLGLGNPTSKKIDSVANNCAELFFDLSSSESDMEFMKEYEFWSDGFEIEKFRELNIHSFDLSPFTDYANDEDSGLTDAVIAVENPDMVGCNFEYVNGLKPNTLNGEVNLKYGYVVEGYNDYYQINFAVTSNNTIKPTYKILNIF